MYRKRRKDKEVTSSPGGSGSPTGLNTEIESRPYLDDDFTQERIIDVDLLPLVLPPYGVDYNEWLATHSAYNTLLIVCKPSIYDDIYSVSQKNPPDNNNNNNTLIYIAPACRMTSEALKALRFYGIFTQTVENF